MDLISTGDYFGQKTDEVFEDMGQVIKVVNDIATFAIGFSERVEQVEAILERCRANGITLNKIKFQFGQETVKFAGFILSKDGVGADLEKLSAMAKFPIQTNIGQLRSFLGLVEQLADFTKEIGATASPLRPLLRAKNVFLWDAQHDRAFEDVKRALVSLPILANYEPGRPLILHTDASRSNGLGFALLQEEKSGIKHL